MKSFKELRAPSDRILTHIKEQAFATLTPETAGKFHLAVVPRIYPAGHKLSLVDVQVEVPQDAVLVFVDEMPGANYGHPCRYRFYSPDDGRLLLEQAAGFPPETADRDAIVEVFHAPQRLELPQPLLYKTVDWAKVRPFPWGIDDDNRFALLFTSQISNRRHVEDLEFAWRILRHRLGFPAGHIYVLCYDGTIGATDATPAQMATWIGDGTPYQMHVHASATKQHFQDALNAIGARMNHESLLFIHTNNHGSPSGLCIDNSSVLTPPEWGTMLGGMSSFGKLVVTMEQCYSGAFSQPTLDHSRAMRTSFASAVPASKQSAGAPHFDPWAQAWFEAVNGFTAYGAGLPASADANANGRVSVREAFNYSDVYDTALSTYDDPQYADKPTGCGAQIYLTRTATTWELLRALIESYETIAAELRLRPPLPDPPPFWERELTTALAAVQALATSLGLKLGHDAASAQAPAAAGAALAGPALAAASARSQASGIRNGADVA